jgi:transcriptional repressor of cell division inhibition gene dicB
MTFQQVVDHFGSVRKIAEALGIGRKAVHAWKNIGVPILRQYQIQTLTNGALVAEPPARQMAG